MNMFAVTCIDSSDTASGKPCCLGVFRTRKEAAEYVRDDVKRYAETNNLKEGEYNETTGTAWVDNTTGCEWKIDEVGVVMSDYNKAKETAISLACVTNNYSREGLNTVLSYMLSEHCTLQQMFTNRFIIPFIREMAKRDNNGNNDPRNAAACKACKDMWEGLKQARGLSDDDDFNLPMI